MVEGKKQHARIEGFRGQLGFSEASRENVCQRTQCTLDLANRAGVLGDEVIIHVQPSRRQLYD